jgi:hypothetical protein
MVSGYRESKSGRGETIWGQVGVGRPVLGGCWLKQGRKKWQGGETEGDLESNPQD